MSSDNFVFGLVQDLGTFLMQLRNNLDSAERFTIFMRKLGWDVSLNSANMTQIQNMFSVNDLDTKIIQPLVKIITDGTSPTISDYGSILDALITIIKTIQNFSTNPPINNIPPFVAGFDWLEFSTDLMGSLICEYLESRKPTLFIILRVLGLIDTQSRNMTGIMGRVSYVKKNIRLDRLSNLVNANNLLMDVYKWKSPFDSKGFLDSLKDLLDSIWFYASYDANNANQLDIPIMKADNTEDGKIDVSILISTLPSDGSGQPGILVSPSLTGMPNEIDLGNFVFKLEGIQLGNSIGLKIRPKQITISGTNPITNNTDVAFSLSYKPDNPIFIFGSAQSTNLNISDCSVRVSISNPVSDPELVISIDFSNVQLSVDTSDSDSFIQKTIGNLLPSMNMQDFGIKWSSKYGLAFKGNPSLQATVGIHQTIGPLSIDSLFIGFSEDNSNLILSLAASGGLQIGPIGATVDRIGIKLVVKSQLIDSTQDSQNSLPLSLGFKHPNGIGLSIDAGPVTGGGYIQLDPDKGEYAGLLQIGVDIPVTSIEITIIGILDTKLPGGVPGYSFLLIVTSEFTPIELGFGFTLNGVGGLAGINRSMNLDQLRAGFKNHITPFHQEEPIIARAPQIISQISSIFPVTQGSYVFGFMLELGWGDPPIIDAELGIILQLPDPIYIVLLGTFKAGLPTIEDPDLAIVLIQIDILGIIDFEHQQFTLQGILYDSRVVEFQLSGGMAMLLDWSPNPQFIMSVGGFYPSFPVPTGFPTPDRLTITYGISNVNLVLKTYFAVTSNSAQVGAHLEVNASKAGFTLEGHLNFDALFIFNPFSFVVDMSAGVSILHGGSVIMSIQLDFTLSGPKPLHGHGSASFCILFFSVTIPVDFTIGDAAESQPAKQISVLPLLQAALQSTNAWSAQLPQGAGSLVTYAKLPSGDQTLYVDPMGSITIRQKVVPLNTQIDKFGSAIPTDGSSYIISAVSVNSAAQTLPSPTDIEDEFARGQFQNMSDSDKISKPSFEKMPSGIHIGTTDFQTNIPNQDLDLTYDTYYIEDPLKPAKPVMYGYQPSFKILTSAVLLGASANSPARNMGSWKYVPPGNVPVVTIKAQEYTIVNTQTMAPVAGLTPEDTSMTAVEGALQAHLSANPQDIGQMQVIPVQEAQAA